MPCFSVSRLLGRQASQPSTTRNDQDPISRYLLHNPKCIIKIFVLGAPDIGKRSLCSRLSDDIFPQNSDPTENGHFRRRVPIPAITKFGAGAEVALEAPYHQVMVEWTTILTEASRIIPSVIRHMVRQNEAYMLVYRVDSRESFNTIEVLLKDYIQFNRDQDDDAALFLVANCVDLPRDQWTVTEGEGMALAEKLGADFFPCSAKTGRGCGLEIITAIVNAVLVHRVNSNS